MGKSSLRYLGPIIWNLVPENIKNFENVDKFRLAIRNWKPENCPCRLCQVYIDQLGFVEN